ncbi:hypothetical protein IMSAGC009_01608 [Lachnospiraceae bacterium]|nr:hypothetical protein IMSAGC009_01608 [Lachnospiraceae bacterium]
MKKSKVWSKVSGLFIMLFILGQAMQVCAVQECTLLQMLVDDKRIVSYIECGSKINSADAQVSQYPCENVEVIQPKNLTVHTVIMLDNSLSITESNRETIKEILRQYVQELPENEAVSFAVFGEDIEFLAEKSKDTEELVRLIDETGFQNQDTYLTDYLYEAVEKIENDTEYTRFIVISDGVDNKAIGITKEELLAKLEETPRPVYTIGHVYKDNSSELKNMFALSRATGGKELLIDDYEDIGLITKEIHDFSHIYSIQMDVPENVMDGESRHILMNIHTDGGDVEATGEVSMPFTLAPEEPEPSAEPTAAPTPEPTPAPTTAPTPEAIPVPEPPRKGIGVEKTAGVVILVIAVIFLVLNQKKKKSSNKSRGVKPPVPEPAPKSVSEEDETTILDGRYLLVLRDRANPERIFRYPMDGHVIVGRNIDMVQIPVDYDQTVSGQHCEFYIKNNRFFIRDMNSVNHTYLENTLITSEREIISGSIVRLGAVEFSVEFMPI